LGCFLVDTSSKAPDPLVATNARQTYENETSTNSGRSPMAKR
jgi:hypothetical protein